MTWIWNPKVKGSGIITCIPQTGLCPNKCADCYFQSGRSYLEPLEENLPHIPAPADAAGRVVRMNDGNDSNIERDSVLEAAQHFKDVFFNTAIPQLDFPGPVVLTANPGGMTDQDFHQIKSPPPNLMYVRFRMNTWNLRLADKAIAHYIPKGVPVVLTFMAYFKSPVPFDHSCNYEERKRTLNTYWAITNEAWADTMRFYRKNPLVYSCGREGVTSKCQDCGNCLREYHRTKERLRTR